MMGEVWGVRGGEIDDRSLHFAVGYLNTRFYSTECRHCPCEKLDPRPSKVHAYGLLRFIRPSAGTVSYRSGVIIPYALVNDPPSISPVFRDALVHPTRILSEAYVFRPLKCSREFQARRSCTLPRAWSSFLF